MINEERIVHIDKKRTKMEMLDQWLRDLTFPGEPKDFIQEISGHGESVEVHRKICFYTDNYCYFITAIERENKSSYLGCSVTTRKTRAGEEWVRGNDLPDGDFTEKTWIRILNAILCYELEKLSTFQKPSDTVSEETT
jgi:hypothetical protein